MTVYMKYPQAAFIQQGRRSGVFIVNFEPSSPFPGIFVK